MLSQANYALKLLAAQRLSVRRLLNHSFRPETLMAHTIKVIAAGFGLLGLCLLIGAWLGSPTSAGLATAAKVFIPLWLVGAAINMWLGSRRRGTQSPKRSHSSCWFSRCRPPWRSFWRGDLAGVEDLCGRRLKSTLKCNDGAGPARHSRHVDDLR